MDEGLELSLPSKIGALIVSPLKRKRGRPVGSKNLPKSSKGSKKAVSVAMEGPRKKQVPKSRVSGVGKGANMQLAVVVDGEGVIPPFIECSSVYKIS